jgi:hypothetical protein
MDASEDEQSNLKNMKDSFTVRKRLWY